MRESNSNTCPFCSMNVAAGMTSCPNCGGLIPIGDSDVGRPSGTPGGLDASSPPLPQVPESSDASFSSSSDSTSMPVFASAPHLAPTPATGDTTSHLGRNIAIIVGIVVIVIGMSTCGAIIWLLQRESGAISSPPQMVSVNQPIQDELTYRQNSKLYEFNLVQGGLVSIACNGDFDTYLELYIDGVETPMTEDDDSGGNLNALINANLAPGRYFVLVRPFSEGTTGSYTLVITSATEPPLTPTPPGSGIVPPPSLPPSGPAIPGYPSGAEIQRQTLAGQVVSAAGNAPVSTGTNCTVFVEGQPVGGSLNCRIRVICGTNVIYGQDNAALRYGYTSCAVWNSPAGGQMIQANDANPTPADGDPRMSINTQVGEISVSDEGPTGSWSVQIRVTVETSPQTPPTAT